MADEFSLVLDENSIRAEQPNNILITLKPHQLTSLNKAIVMEREGEIKYKITNLNSYANLYYDNSNLIADDYIKIGTNIGIFGDMVGYGKTIIALSLIASNPLDKIYRNPIYFKTYSNYRNYNYLNMSVSNNLIKKENNIINSTLIIVPRGPVYIQWERTIKEQTKLRLLSITNLNFIKSNLPKYNGNNREEIFNYFNNYDIVLIKNTTLKTLYDEYYKDDNILKNWKRIMVDEAHDIIYKLPNNMNYYYLWLISGTYIDILRKTSCNYTNGIKEMLNDNSLNLILVRNNPRFIQTSFNIPEPIEKFYLCKLNSKYLIAKRYLTPSIIDKINANDFAGAIKELGGKNETEDNIIELVSKELKRELFNLEAERDFYNLQDISQEDKDNKIKNITIKIENQKNKINDLKDRIKMISTNDCAICLDKVENPVMLECTHIFCGKCILNLLRMRDNNNCPYCRTKISSYDKLTAVINDSNNDNKIMTKEDTLISIIQNKMNGKFLVFTKYDNGFELIRNKMNELSISYEFLKGNTSQMMNILDRFKNGKLNVILLNTLYAGSGIDISFATDIIFYHKMGIDKQQAIGRGQRVGRTNQLIIHNLYYENEF
jgi:superfamily II DNA or RNA helicase